jgi:SAM-dependent methyltransferase
MVRGAMPKLYRRQIDAAAWDIFAGHQPYYHILSHPSMLSPGPAQQKEFWTSGIRDIRRLGAFGGLSFEQGTGVDLGCGLGRLTRAMQLLTTRQIGLDISGEMLHRAREANRAFSCMEFRQISADYWPIETESCVLVISLYVLQHMSSLDLMEHSIREMGRILVSRGKAVFNVPTLRWRGHLIQWIRSSWQPFNGVQRKQRLKALEERLARHARMGSETFTEGEIMHDMFELDCRRMKSLSISRLRAAMRTCGLKICRMERGEFGLTLVAVEKR